MDDMNKQRADWADRAVMAFQITTGTDRDDAITDFLADLMHLCDDEGGESFNQYLETARMHYEAEIIEQAEQPSLFAVEG